MRTPTATRERTRIVMVDPIPLVQIPPEAPLEMSRSGLVKLMTFLSPAFPVGGFSYSHGLEWAIDHGIVKDASSLADWITDLISRGSFWCDAVLCKEAFSAAEAADEMRLDDLAELAEALTPSRERHLETIAMGTAFMVAIRAAWPADFLNDLSERHRNGLAYPVAVGAVAAEHAIPIGDALPVYLNSLAANLVSVAVRLVPLGQSDGLRVLAALEPLLLATATRALAATLDDLGSATFQSDIASMRHETQYSRVFRT